MNMKIAILIALTVIFGIPAAAEDFSGWCGWHFVGDMRFGMAAWGSSVDGLDQNDHLATPSQYGWMAGSYHVNGQDAWGGLTGFYDYDDRAPLLPGQTKTWMIYIWALPESPYRNIELAAGQSFAYNQTDPLVLAKFEYVQKPAGVVDGPALGTVWTNPNFSLNLPYYATDNGLTGYGFKFTLSMVPEPSSILALVGGIAGLGGFALRRRRS
jgi:hypothetical protein